MSEQEGSGVRTSDVTRETGSALSTADIAAATRSESVRDTQASMTQQSEVSSNASTPLFGDQETETFQDRWMDIQTAFVDEPRRAVEQADTLVAEVIRRLAEIFAEERNELEGQWGRGGQVSTEDLRLAMQRYRSFFSRLLSIERPT